ncbi:MAG: CC/Se motif family (seleno)protein [Desulfotomaculaceae bacterium]|nr:CC/Se motif family (seleno)protein [Desulfotomaculaceae bacterium]
MSVISPDNSYDALSNSEKMLKVEISEDAKSYILDKGGIITITVVRGFGCTDNLPEPVVLIGKTGLAEINPNEVLTNDIMVYISKEVVTEPDGIKINLVNKGEVQTLEVEGIIINY